MRLSRVALAAVLMSAGANAQVVPVGEGGEIDPRIVTFSVQQESGRIQDCYERELAIFAELQGRVTVEFRLRPSGAIDAAAVIENTTLDEELASCVVRVFESIRIDPGPTGAVRFRYPFEFRPTEDVDMAPMAFGPAEAPTSDLDRRVTRQLWIAIARRRAGNSRACFHLARTRNSAITRGEVEAAITVSPNGLATRSWITSDSIGDGQVARCVLRAVQRLGRLNPAPVGEARTYRFRFVFGRE